MTDRTVNVRLVAVLDDLASYELGAATLTRDWHGVELAALLRAVADEVEQQGPQDPRAPFGEAPHADT
jgi:hypothetical protein